MPYTCKFETFRPSSLIGCVLGIEASCRRFDHHKVSLSFRTWDAIYLIYERPLEPIEWCHHHLHFLATLNSYIWEIYQCNFLTVWSCIPPIGAFNPSFFSYAIFWKDTGKILSNIGYCGQNTLLIVEKNDEFHNIAPQIFVNVYGDWFHCVALCELVWLQWGAN